MPLVNIQYTLDGEFAYDKPSCGARRRETVEWYCGGNGYYAIHLGWDSPLEEITYQKPLGTRITAPVPEGARRGRYKYTVVIVDTDLKKIFVDDPELIIKG